MPLLERRVRDLFKPRRNATAGFLSTRGNLNIEEHNPPSPPLPPPQFRQVPHLHLSYLEELLLILQQKIKKKVSVQLAHLFSYPPTQTLGGGVVRERVWR